MGLSKDSNLQESVDVPDQAEHPEGLSQQLNQSDVLQKATPQKHAYGEAETCRQIGFRHLYLWRYVSVRKHLRVKLIHGLYMEGEGDEELK